MPIFTDGVIPGELDGLLKEEDGTVLDTEVGVVFELDC